MTKFKTTKFSTALWMIGAVVIAGCQSVTPATNNMAQEVLKPSTCVVEPPPVDENGKPMPVDLDDTLSMELRVFFDKDSSELKEQYTPELNKIIAFADRCSNLTFFVQGHTSKIEQQAIDEKALHLKGSSQPLDFISLASARAQSIKNYLVNLDLPAYRIRTFDCSADNPIAPNDTEEGAIMNQRAFGWISARDRYDQMLLECREF